MSAAVESIYMSQKDTAAILQALDEVSLLVALEGSARKILLLAAASYFEVETVRQVTGYVRECAKGNPILPSIIQVKAVSRQYHSWFDWKGPGMGPFYGMLGPEFAKFYKNLLQENPDKSAAVDAFLSIGQDRNRLVHEDLASFTFEKTSDEVYALFKVGILFVNTLGDDLRTFSAALEKPEDSAAVAV